MIQDKESTIQAQSIEWLYINKQRYDLFFWRYHNRAEPGRNHTGIKGVADLICILKNGQTIWIEFKSKNGKQSCEQLQFEQEVKRRGHYYLLANSVDEFINKFKAIIGKINL